MGDFESDRGFQEMEMEMKMGCDSFVKRGIKKDENFVADDKNGGGVKVEGVENNNKERPPVDDVCPICFDKFDVPCKSNCGHWFCANCILQFWMYRSSIRPCKCPLCCCGIVSLSPETSQLTRPTNDVIKVLKKVKQYNDLYAGGVQGTFLRALALPLFMRRIFGLLINPDGLRCIYYVMRLLGLLLALMYEKAEFEFIPTGGLGIRRTFDMGASVLVGTFFLAGVGHRWMVRSRERRMALALHASDAS